MQQKATQQLLAQQCRHTAADQKKCRSAVQEQALASSHLFDHTMQELRKHDPLLSKKCPRSDLSQVHSANICHVTEKIELTLRSNAAWFPCCRTSSLVLTLCAVLLTSSIWSCTLHAELASKQVFHVTFSSMSQYDTCITSRISIMSADLAIILLLS